MRNLVTILLLLSLYFAGCSVGSTFVKLDVLKKELKLEKFPDQKDYPDADGIILLNADYVDMSVGDNSFYTEETIHVVKKLFRNIEDHATVELTFDSDEELESINARTVEPDGTPIVLTDKDFYTTTGVNGGDIFYSDIKSVKFTFPALVKDCIIEYTYKELEKRPFISDTWFIQDDMPTLCNEYYLSVPALLVASKDQGGAGWNWNYKTYNYNLDRPAVGVPSSNKYANTTLDEKVVYYWSLKNIPAFKPEDMMPPEINYISYVKFAPTDWTNWDDVAGWYYTEMFQPQLVITDKIKKEAEKLEAGAKTEAEKIKSAYDYVKKLRYVSIDLGEGGYEPHTPEEVLDKQYGDCKDKSILLVALLKSMGIKSQPVLVLTKDEGTVDANFPSWFFNHMIVKTKNKDGKNYWLDGTATYCPFGQLPAVDQGINVLVLSDSGTAQIQKTPEADFTQNQEDINLTINVHKEGNADFTADIKYYGEYNEYHRDYFQDKTDKEMKEFCKSLIADNYTDPEIKEYSLKDIDSSKTGLELKFSFTAQDALQKEGNLYFVNSDPFVLGVNTDLFLKDKRVYPVDFDFGKDLKKEIEINLPSGMKINNLPNNVAFDAQGIGYYKGFLTSANSHINIQEDLVIKDPIIQASEYQTLKKDIDKIKMGNNEKIILTE
jgi:Domain of Unknown Function with PDB structure (DUF3857)/Transglutaminase-like superfamily